MMQTAFLLEMMAILQLHNFYAMAGHSFFSACSMPSTVVAHIEYITDTATLRITYTSGAKYEYLHVPPTIYAALKSSSSKGIYLNKFIKGVSRIKRLMRATSHLPLAISLIFNKLFPDLEFFHIYQ